jgi:hypothetical protein
MRMTGANPKGDSLPRTLLESVSWTFRGRAYSDRKEFEAAVHKLQNPARGGVWRPDEIVLRVGRVRISPDVAWYLTEEHPIAELVADNGVAFTAGELLFKVHNTFVAQLDRMDHKYFEGFTLADQQQDEEPPLYDLDLGS